MRSFQEYCRLRESEDGGLDQVAGIGSDDENFHVQFSIRDLIAKAQRHPVVDVPVAELTPLLQGRMDDDSPTQARVEAAELRYPIIVVANDAGRIFAIADGTHRLEKAASMGLETIKAHVIPKGEMAGFATEPSEYSVHHRKKTD